MAESQFIKLDSALRDSLDEIDKSYARKIQGDMYRCSARCCDKTNDSIESVYICVKQCSTDFGKLQIYLQNEYNQFQSRFQRCILQCGDSVVDNLKPDPSPSEMAKLNHDYETCVINCANKHMELVPGFLKRVKEVLKNKRYLNLQMEDDPKSLREPTLLLSDK